MSSDPRGVYPRIGVLYLNRYGEPLVADWDWVEPIYDMVRGALESDPTLNTSVDNWLSDLDTRAAERTADVIHVITYGLHYTQGRVLRLPDIPD